jgi:putative nucleotidyltransferase with HDIG domain
MAGEITALDRIVDAIPSIGRLREEALQLAVARSWQAALDASPFDRLDQVPQSPVMPDRSLLDHVNEVNERTESTIALARQRFDLDVDDDVVLATAILHDVDTPLIFRFDGSKFFAAEGTRLEQHGSLGADLALRHGVPSSVAELVRVHSPFASTGLPGTIEGTIVHYADLLCNDLASLQWKVAPIFPNFTAHPVEH